MAQAAAEYDLAPREISFKGTLQTMQAIAERLPHATHEKTEELHQWLLLAIAHHTVGNRPNRIEPRKRKRHPKHYPLLTQPREIARRQLLASA